VAALLAAVLVAGAAAVVLTAVLPRPGPGPVPARVRSWRADIAYLARELPRRHINGLTGASLATWDATAAHLEAEVPRLPHSHLQVVYTTKVANPPGNRLATPDIVITPTISQVLAGTDPVLDRAFSYPLPSRAGR
jgi:hypothetical protein